MKKCGKHWTVASSSKRTPERDLWGAVLARAFVDLCAVGDDRRTAEKWLILAPAVSSSEEPAPFSLQWVCRVLDLDFGSVRSRARQLVNKPRSAFDDFFNIKRGGWGQMSDVSGWSTEV